MSTTYTVTGIQYCYEVILQYDTVEFQSDSKLVLGPVTEKPSGAPRTLTIIADSITIANQAEITYDLNGDKLIDADTPAENGTSSTSPGDNGHPNYTSSSPNWVGGYPRAADGGDGKPGQRGEDGSHGVDAPTLEIWVKEVSTGSMKINFKGQDGGKGGDGSDGGDGGGGQKGAKSKKDDAWYDGEECTQEPGQGGNGGRGGDAGWPGRGGDGGNGGIVKVFTKSASLPYVNAWNYIVDGGKGGDPGKPGSPGTGGPGGPQGDKVGPCPTRPEYAGSKGPDGQTMDDMDPHWDTNLKGEDGVKGDDSTHEINIMPH